MPLGRRFLEDLFLSFLRRLLDFELERGGSLVSTACASERIAGSSLGTRFADTGTVVSGETRVADSTVASEATASEGAASEVLAEVGVPFERNNTNAPTASASGTAAHAMTAFLGRLAGISGPKKKSSPTSVIGVGASWRLWCGPSVCARSAETL